VARLEIRGIDVRFGSVSALRQVDLSAEAGAVTGLIGSAGAGKTTVFNVITGQQKPQAGTVVLDGQDVTSLPPHRRARLGIARTFERLEVFGSLTVRENILVAAEMRRRWSRDGANTRKVADDVMEELGLRALSRVRCDGLPPGLARLVEVGRALATRPSVLLLDEPSAGLDAAGRQELWETVSVLARQRLVVVATHDWPWLLSNGIWVVWVEQLRVTAPAPASQVSARIAAGTDLLHLVRRLQGEGAAVSAWWDPTALAEELWRAGGARR
jgi:branched-chain amino acid transport system ATP-binding protein